MKAKYYIFLVLILIIILLSFLLGRSCSRVVSPNMLSSDTISVTDTIYTQRIDTVITYVPEPYKITISDTLVILDSNNCLNLSQLFHSTFAYKDTLVNDSTLFFVLNENVSRNKITFRSVDYKTFDKNITETVTVINTVTAKEKINMLMFVGINRNLQTLKNTAFMDFTAYYKRVGIITGFTSDGCVKIGVGLKW